MLKSEPAPESQAESSSISEASVAELSPDAELRRLLRESGTKHRVLRRLSLVLAPLYHAIANWQARRQGVNVERHNLQLPRFPIDAPPLRAVFLSDLHYGSTTGAAATATAWRLAREAEPDILFFGGDLLYGDSRGLPVALRELLQWKRNPPPGGMYACLGNHDYLQGAETITTCLEACGVTVLVNDAVPLPEPWQRIWIAGADDSVWGDMQPSRALEKLPPNTCAILLAHEPDVCEFDAPTHCALTLCGHTHGGQICLPNGEPLWVASNWSREYTAGLYRHAGQWLFVSRGVGNVGLPIRLWAPPDIAVLELSGPGRHGVRVVRNS